MPRSTADWPAIRARYEAGLSAPAIEKELPRLPDGRPTVTRQAILKRARKEGWLQGLTKSTSISEGDGASAEAVALVSLWAPLLARQLQDMGKLAARESRLALALEMYGRGGNHSMAAAAAGVDIDTWRAWRVALPDLERAIAELQAAEAVKHLKRIDDAGARGDWKAAEAMLKANPLTRDEWGGGAKGNGFMGIQINFGPGMPAEALRVIDNEQT